MKIDVAETRRSADAENAGGEGEARVARTSRLRRRARTRLISCGKRTANDT